MAQRDVQLNSQLERRARQLKRPQLELQRKQVAVAALLERFRQAIYKNDVLSGAKKILVPMVDVDGKGSVVNKRLPGH